MPTAKLALVLAPLVVAGCLSTAGFAPDTPDRSGNDPQAVEPLRGTAQAVFLVDRPGGVAGALVVAAGVPGVNDTAAVGNKLLWIPSIEQGTVAAARELPGDLVAAALAREEDVPRLLLADEGYVRIVSFGGTNENRSEDLWLAEPGERTEGRVFYELADDGTEVVGFTIRNTMTLALQPAILTRSADDHAWDTRHLETAGLVSDLDVEGQRIHLAIGGQLGTHYCRGDAGIGITCEIVPGSEAYGVRSALDASPSGTVMIAMNERRDATEATLPIGPVTGIGVAVLTEGAWEVQDTQHASGGGDFQVRAEPGIRLALANADATDGFAFQVYAPNENGGWTKVIGLPAWRFNPLLVEQSGKAVVPVHPSLDRPWFELVDIP